MVDNGDSSWDVDLESPRTTKRACAKSSPPTEFVDQKPKDRGNVHLRTTIPLTNSPPTAKNHQYSRGRQNGHDKKRKRKSKILVRLQLFLQKFLSKGITRNGRAAIQVCIGTALLIAFFTFGSGPHRRELRSIVHNQPKSHRALYLELFGTKHDVRKPEEVEFADVDPEFRESIVDFGGIDMRTVEGDLWERQLYSDPAQKESHVRHHVPEDVWSATDDDYYANQLWSVPDGKELVKDHICRSPEMENNHYPNCVTFHEVEWHERLKRETFKFLGGGGYRDVYRVMGDEDDHMVWKTMIFDSAHGGTKTYTNEDHVSMRIDAIVAELFTSKELITDIYGYCGVSMFSEFMPFGDVEMKAQTFTRGTLENYTDKQLLKMNDLPPRMKLRVALEMAEGIAYLHNYKEGVIVHDDIQLSQFLFTKEGFEDWENAKQIIKFNDFNRAAIMQYDGDHGEYCKWTNGKGAGDWRSPEEYQDLPLDEKIDVFSLGTNIFGLVTGLVPFPEDKTARVQERIIDGELPVIDKRIRKRSFEEDRLADIATKCWTYEPSERPDIHEIVELLREALDESDKHS